MSEEELMKIIKLSREPVHDMRELSQKLVGTRKGMFFYTESFRLDFENMRYKLGNYENRLQRIKKIVDNEKITGIEAKLMIKDILEEIE